MRGFERARSTGADETRVIETKNDNDPVANYPFINRPDGNLSKSNGRAV